MCWLPERLIMSAKIYMVMYEMGEAWLSKSDFVAIYFDKELAEAHANLATKKLKEHLKLVKAGNNRSTNRNTQKIMGDFYMTLSHSTFLDKYVVVEQDVLEAIPV